MVTLSHSECWRIRTCTKMAWWVYPIFSCLEQGAISSGCTVWMDSLNRRIQWKEWQIIYIFTHLNHFKVVDHSKLIILWSFTHTNAIPNLSLFVQYKSKGSKIALDHADFHYMNKNSFFKMSSFLTGWEWHGAKYIMTDFLFLSELSLYVILNF